MLAGEPCASMIRWSIANLKFCDNGFKNNYIFRTKNRLSHEPYFAAVRQGITRHCLNMQHHQKAGNCPCLVGAVIYQEAFD